ncbi:MAG TPA: L-serine ammonia-lyase, partial [Psychromonas hadalis]|nr:L-serine ammonia-lyase [Psychromonas hadalis]
MLLSIFDIYKIGLGPSSSHTNGPMIAGYQFTLKMNDQIEKVSRISVDLFGSLSLTGRGHHTDKASLLGLLGYEPDKIKIKTAQVRYQQVLDTGMMPLSNGKEASVKVVFHEENLPLHENGMSISAFDENETEICTETYYSIGGGFIKTEAELKNNTMPTSKIALPYPFDTAEEMLNIAEKNGLCIGSLVLENEKAFRSQKEIDEKTDQIWKVIQLGLKRGMESEGILEGGLELRRRAPSLLKSLNANGNLEGDPMAILDWINLYAFAMSEENAAGGQVVTSPTNGAAGVIPAVLSYFNKFINKLDTKQLNDFLAVSGAVGMLYKTNASISGAEVGCQGEIGVSSSMAAAGLTALRGGSNEQICMAAEIAMEHSLGMTCDP